MTCSKNNQYVVEHDLLAGSPVTALGATATGKLVVASGGGDLLLLSVLAGPTEVQTADIETVRATVAAFLDGTSDVPDDGGLKTHLVVSDGARTWEQTTWHQ